MSVCQRATSTITKGGTVEQATKVKILEALQDGDLGSFERLWRAGKVGDINRGELNSGDTWLHALTEDSGVALASFLLDCGANVHAANDDGDTPLHYAALQGDVERVRLLIARGAGDNVNVQNNDGRTPLHEARRGAVLAVQDHWDDEPHQRTAALLFEYGADPHLVDNDGRTPAALAQAMMEEDSGPEEETWRDL